jgi:hypothetical protein
MNRAGQFVGSANFQSIGRLGFLYDPQAGIKYFRYHDEMGQPWPTSARAINNLGWISGFMRNPHNGKTFAFLLRDGRYELFEDCGVGETAGGIFIQAINDGRHGG